MARLDRDPREIFLRARAREISTRERKVNALACDADGTRNRAGNVRDKRSSARPRNPSARRRNSPKSQDKKNMLSPFQSIDINRWKRMIRKFLVTKCKICKRNFILYHMEIVFLCIV